jgi:hypothetical protein
MSPIYEIKTTDDLCYIAGRDSSDLITNSISIIKRILEKIDRFLLD